MNQKELVSLAIVRNPIEIVRVLLKIEKRNPKSINDSTLIFLANNDKSHLINLLLEEAQLEDTRIDFLVVVELTKLLHRKKIKSIYLENEEVRTHLKKNSKKLFSNMIKKYNLEELEKKRKVMSF